MWVVAYNRELRQWCVVDLETREYLSSFYATHEEAVQAVETMAFRLAQGWRP